MTIDRVSPLENHRVPGNEIARAADIVTQLQDTPEVISMLESLGNIDVKERKKKVIKTYSTIWANSPFFYIFEAIDFCIYIARDIPVVNAFSSSGETCRGVVDNIF